MAERKINCADPFDLDLTLRGFNVQLMFLDADLYDFCYNFAFKRHRKGYAWRYKVDYVRLFENSEIFMETGDKVIIHVIKYRKLVQEFRDKLEHLFLIDGYEDSHFREDVMKESERYHPYYEYSKARYDYMDLLDFYEGSISRIMYYIYRMASVLTASKYRIPNSFINRYREDKPESFYLLDTDSEIIALMKQLIIDMGALATELRNMKIKRMPKGRWIKFAKGELGSDKPQGSEIGH
jgi:hypothetical protein